MPTYHSRSLSRSRRLLLAGVSLALFAAFVELCSLAGYRLAFGRFFSPSETRTQRQAVLSTGGFNDLRGDATGKSRDVLHPYFGFVRNTNIYDPTQKPIPGSLSMYGFDGRERLFQTEGDGAFVVAITGGSVAKYFGDQALSNLGDFLRRLPQAGGRRLVFLPLGYYAYKEPQQLNVILDFLAQGARIDLLVNLDGFNEISHAPAHNIPVGVSPFFPSGWADRTTGFLSDRAAVLIGKKTLARQIRVQAAKFFSHLPSCATTGFVWKGLDTLLEHRIYVYERQRQLLAEEHAGDDNDVMRLDRAGKVDYGPALDVSLEDYYPDAVRHWARCSALLHNAMAGRGGLYYHFLQPNQYDAGSKPIGPKEAEQALSGESPYKASVEAAYPLLRRAGRALEKAGVRFTDTSRVFEKVDEPLYYDNCCHFNAKGLMLLADAMGEKILADAARPLRPVSMEGLEKNLDEAGIVNIARAGHDESFAFDALRGDYGAVCAVERGLSPAEHNPGKPDECWRWGLGPETVIHLRRGTRARLTYVFANTLPDQGVTVTLNGKPLAVHAHLPPLSDSTRDKGLVHGEVEFTAEAPVNRLNFVYADWNRRQTTHAEDSRPLGVVFYTLRLEGKSPH